MKSRRRKINLEQLTTFYRQMSAMAASGMTIGESVKILTEDRDDSVLSGVIASISSDMEGGTDADKAFMKHPDFFENIPSIAFTESADKKKVSQLFNNLAETIEKNEAVRNKVKGALVYPVAILMIALIITTGLLLFVVPIFGQMFADIGGTLPLPTRIVIALSDVMTDFWYILAAVITAVTVLIKRDQKLRSKLISLVPGLSTIQKMSSLVQFIRQLSFTMTSDISASEALARSSRSVESSTYSEKYTDLAKAMTSGTSLVDVMKKSGLFPLMVVQMVRVGEEADNMFDALSEAANMYEKEVNKKINAMTALMEPAIMVILGCIIGSLIVALYLPIFTMGSNI